jgi:hypothetical protein
VVLTLTLSLGAHWMLLQSVAWIGMVVTYSQDAPFTQALSETFDGRHPCQFCKMVQRGKAQEKKQETQKPATKLDQFLTAKQSVFLFPPKLEWLASTVLPPSLSRCDSPPTPPPERA